MPSCVRLLAQMRGEVLVADATEQATNEESCVIVVHVKTSILRRVGPADGAHAALSRQDLLVLVAMAPE